MGRLPWFGPVFLRSRRLRARFDMEFSSNVIVRHNPEYRNVLPVCHVVGSIRARRETEEGTADMADEIRANVLVVQEGDPIVVVE